MEILYVQDFVDQDDGERFKTVVSNELHTRHAEKTLHDHIAEEEFAEVFGQYKQYCIVLYLFDIYHKNVITYMKVC